VWITIWTESLPDLLAAPGLPAFGLVNGGRPSAADLTDEQLRQCQVLWATVDSPWLPKTDPALFARDLNAIRDLDPTMVLSSHLPAAPGTIVERLLASLEAVLARSPSSDLTKPHSSSSSPK
jgi:hypothetical protein